MVIIDSVFSDSHNYRIFHSFLVHFKEELQLDEINQLFLVHYDCENGSKNGGK